MVGSLINTCLLEQSKGNTPDVFYSNINEIIDGVLESIKEHGYELYRPVGNIREAAEIVDPRKKVFFKNRPIWLGLLGEEKIMRPMLLGTIWFNNFTRGATYDSWIFEVCGKANVETAKNLATKIKPKGTRVEIKLLCDSIQPKTYFTDDPRV